MRLISVTPSHGGSEFARASIEVADGIRLHDVKVTRTGCVLARNATFSPEVIQLILDTVKGRSLNANR